MTLAAGHRGGPAASAENDVARRLLGNLGFVLTAACNLRCGYCYRAGAGRDAMSWDLLSRVFRDLLPHCAPTVECAFTGGEPLLAMPVLRRAIEEGERLAARSGRRITWRVMTNGLLLNPEALAFLDAHRARISLSCDGAEASQLARGAGTFGAIDGLLDRIYRDYPLLWQTGLELSMTVTPDNAAALPDNVAYLLRKGACDVRLAPAMGPTGCGWAPERIGELERAFEAVSEMMLRHVERTGISPLRLYRKVGSAGPSRPSSASRWLCRAHQVDGLTIDVDGRAYACVLATASYRRATSERLEQAVRALDAGPVGPGAVQARRRAVQRAARRARVFQHPARCYSSYGRCRDCPDLTRCPRCPLAAAPEPGWPDPRRIPDFLCAYNRVSLAHRDRFPAQAPAMAFGV